MFGLGTSELIVILIIALIVFGPQKLPQIGGAIGNSIKEFKKALKDDDKDKKDDGKKELDGPPPEKDDEKK